MGHRLQPHTADVIVAAWGKDREQCIEQAVAGLVESFVDTRGVVPASEHAVVLAEDDDTELLIAALDEVIYLVDAAGVVPVQAVAVRRERGLLVRYATVPLRDVETTGPVPKGVTRHRLDFGAADGVWRCSVVIDV